MRAASVGLAALALTLAAFAAPLAAQQTDTLRSPAEAQPVTLLRSGDVRPLLSDLKLTTIVYDGRFAARSVAVLRDITNRRIYRVKTGDIIGRLKVTQIRPREIVFTVQEFGFERQETLSLARQEETP